LGGKYEKGNEKKRTCKRKGEIGKIRGELKLIMEIIYKRGKIMEETV
jgi:hypothetical protein